VDPALIKIGFDHPEHPWYQQPPEQPQADFR